MGKFLKRNGRFVKRNGKLVVASNPANCRCCVIVEPPTVQWFCDNGKCRECVVGEEPEGGKERCPEQGETLFRQEQECLDSCSPPGVVWVCLDSGACAQCYNDEAPGVPPNETGKPDCSSLPPHSGSYGTKPDCIAACFKEVICWVCVSGGVCIPQAYNTPGGACPPDAYPNEDLCKASCGGNPLP